MKVMALTVVAGMAASAYAGDCPGDCNGDGQASVLDFVCFQTEWQNQTEAGDCNGDGMYSILDFVCFQGEWQDFANGGCDGGDCNNGAPDTLDEDFEYGVGDLCGQCNWEPWDLDPAWCSPIVDDQANSGANSLRLQPGGDMVQVFDISEGVWEVKAQTYISSDSVGDGYFIMLNTYAHGGAKDWSMQVMFDPQLGIVEAQDQAFEIALIVTDAWAEIRAIIDLDNDTVDIFYNGEQFVFGGNWSDGANVGIQCIDLFSNGLDGMYYDDVSLQPVP